MSKPNTPTPAPFADQIRWFAEEVSPHDARLRFYLRRSFPSLRDVDDIAQESYLRIWKARLAQPVHSTKSFLFTIARHLAFDTIRRNRLSQINPVMETDASAVMDHGPGVIDTVCSREEIALFIEAIDTLPPRCREIIILRKLEGRSQAAIAQMLEISEHTVEVQVMRGMKRCDQYLHDRGVSGFPRRGSC
ncbi:MAG: RNA polymerase sigma factor [Opitutaceae bacterium]